MKPFPALSVLALVLLCLVMNFTPPFKNTREIARNTLAAITVKVIAYNEDGSECSHGTGFVYSPGPGAPTVVVTARHVVELAGPNAINVQFEDGPLIKARQVTVSSEADVAVIYVGQPRGMRTPAIALAEARVGDTAWLMGYPLDQGRTFTEGLVDGYTNAEIYNAGDRAISITCGATRGNSGCAVLNEKGEIIGMFTLMSSDPFATNLLRYCISGPYLRNKVHALMERIRDKF